MTIYISGPMTGMPDENRPAFNEVAQALRAAGRDVFNPAENGLPATATWSQHMRVDIAALMDCDSILLLPGWQFSKGATLELVIALDLGMTVHYEIENLIERSNNMNANTIENRFAAAHESRVRFTEPCAAKNSKDRSSKAVIIYGPKGCGKTIMAALFAAYYVKSKVYDDGRMPETYDSDTLVLTNNPAVPGAINYYEALMEVRSAVKIVDRTAVAASTL